MPTDTYGVQPSILLDNPASPYSAEDLKAIHADPMYKLVSGTRDAYWTKHIADKLAQDVTKSDDVRNLGELVGGSAKELERLWRMAACMSDAPVSTKYPYLPVMTAKAASVAAGLAKASKTDAGDTSDNSQEGPAVQQNSIIFHAITFPLIRHLSRTKISEFI